MTPQLMSHGCHMHIVYSIEDAAGAHMSYKQAPPSLGQPGPHADIEIVVLFL